MPVRTQFWRFTHVLRKIWRCVTRKMASARKIVQPLKQEKLRIAQMERIGKDSKQKVTKKTEGLATTNGHE
jgi:hypothetical protein